MRQRWLVLQIGPDLAGVIIVQLRQKAGLQSGVLHATRFSRATFSAHDTRLGATQTPRPRPGTPPGSDAMSSPPFPRRLLSVRSFSRYRAPARAKLAPTRPQCRPESACATARLSTSRCTLRSGIEVFCNGISRQIPSPSQLQPAIGTINSHCLPGLNPTLYTFHHANSAAYTPPFPGPTRRLLSPPNRSQSQPTTTILKL